MKPPSVAPRTPCSVNVGNSPWISVSTEPMVMTMKPQKMMKWYLLPIAVTNFGSRLAGSVVFSTTFFWPKKNTSTDASRSFGRSERPSGRRGSEHPQEAPHGPGKHREGGDEEDREGDASHQSIIVTQSRSCRPSC